MSALDIFQISALSDNYQYLLVCKVTRDAVVVDPPDADKLIAEVERLGVRLVAVWNTHHHADHVGGNLAIVKHYAVPVYCSVYDRIYDRIPDATHSLKDGDQVSVGKAVFKVMEIPGHTLGHIAYLGESALFCGDTLFAGGCGRLFEGTPEMMAESLERISKLPPETLIYCAHEYTERNLDFALMLEPGNIDLQKRMVEVKRKRGMNLATVPSTLKEELATNPFLRTMASQEILDNLARKGYTALNDAVKVFAAIRELKDRF